MKTAFSIRLLAVSAAALGLAACGGNDPVDENAAESASLPAPPSLDTSDPSGAPPPPNASTQPEPGNARSNSAAIIPAALRGRWGLVPGDCVSTRGDAKGLLIIGERELRFYESSAVPQGNVESGDSEFSADFAYTGEGMTWTKYQALRLQDGKLIRTESSPMASYTYARCS